MNELPSAWPPSLILVLCGAAGFALSGFIGAGTRGARRTAIVAVAAAVAGVCGAVGALATPAPVTTTGVVAVDALSAVILLPVFVVPALGSVYGVGYAPAEARLRVYYGLLAAALAIVLVAREIVVFLVAWEIMALSAFLLVATHDDEAEVRSASWTYMIATHTGTLALFAFFSLWRETTGATILTPALGATIAPATAAVMFALALIGFGLKAGLAPLHFWLPGAHAAAPSHVSALLSGVVLNIGIYGILRATTWLPFDPFVWGPALLVVGAVSAVGGIAFAAAQRDFKRLLAYSSVENMGVVILGIGLALCGRALARPDLIALGLGGAVLHLWNHSLYKPLLFFGAGAVLHATGSRDMERLGGLARRMPVTAGLLVFGAVAVAGLPPLNGFLSEWLLYTGFFRAAVSSPWPALAAAAIALAFVGALASAALLRFCGTLLLGQPRSAAAAAAHESGPWLQWPMLVPVAGCLLMMFAYPWVTPALDTVVANWAATAAPPLATLVPWGPLTALPGIVLVLAAVAAAPLWRWRNAQPRVGTWDCGYSQPTARMQYSGSSFSQFLGDLYRFLLRPRVQRPRLDGPFAARSRFVRDVPDPILDGTFAPVTRQVQRLLPTLRRLQQGHLQAYLLYVLATIVALLLWAMPRGMS